MLTEREDLFLESFDGAVGLAEPLNQKPELHGVGYGCLVHTITNLGAAIADLTDEGNPELVPTAIRSRRHQLSRWRNLPRVVEECGSLPGSKFGPHSKASCPAEVVSKERTRSAFS